MVAYAYKLIIVRLERIIHQIIHITLLSHSAKAVSCIEGVRSCVVCPYVLGLYRRVRRPTVPKLTAGIGVIL